MDITLHDLLRPMVAEITHKGRTCRVVRDGYHPIFDVTDHPDYWPRSHFSTYDGQYNPLVRSRPDVGRHIGDSAYPEETATRLRQKAADLRERANRLEEQAEILEEISARSDEFWVDRRPVGPSDL